MLETGRGLPNIINYVPHTDVMNALAVLGDTEDQSLVLDTGIAMGLEYTRRVQDAFDTIKLVDTVTAVNNTDGAKLPDLMIEEAPLRLDSFSLERSAAIVCMRDAWVKAFKADRFNFRRELVEDHTSSGRAYIRSRKLMNW